MKVRAARSTDVYQFNFFDTPDGPDHVREVEGWVRRNAWAWYREPSSADRCLLVADDDAEIVGVFAHELVRPGVRLLVALLVHHENRGHGLGRQLLDAAVADMRERTPDCSIFGIVAPENVPMLQVLSTTGAIDGGLRDRYRFFHS